MPVGATLQKNDRCTSGYHSFNVCRGPWLKSIEKYNMLYLFGVPLFSYLTPDRLPLVVGCLMWGLVMEFLWHHIFGEDTELPRRIDHPTLPLALRFEGGRRSQRPSPLRVDM